MTMATQAGLVDLIGDGPAIEKAEGNSMTTASTGSDTKKTQTLEPVVRSRVHSRVPPINSVERDPVDAQ